MQQCLKLETFSISSQTLRLLLQNAMCNATGSRHTDLFPMNNDTLEVDIYKGVSELMKPSTVITVQKKL